MTSRQKEIEPRNQPQGETSRKQEGETSRQLVGEASKQQEGETIPVRALGMHAAGGGKQAATGVAKLAK